VQEALLRAFRALPRFRGDARMDTWLHTIVRNAALEQLRNRKSRIEISIEQRRSAADDLAPREFLDPNKSPEEFYERREQENVLRYSMNELTSACKVAVQMCVLEDLPLRQAAIDLNISVTALKSRLFHGRRMLETAIRRRTRQQDNSIAALVNASFGEA
jgi:RNA polymerase sigma-70 factor, ECF subfamily